MVARVITTGKVSKAKGASVAAVRLELPTGAEVTTLVGRPQDPSPTVAQVRATALGIGLALVRGATRVEVVTPSKTVARAISSEPGGRIDDYHGSLLAGWAIYFLRDRCPDGWAVEVAKDDDLEAVAKAALAKGAEPASLPGVTA